MTSELEEARRTAGRPRFSGSSRRVLIAMEDVALAQELAREMAGYHVEHISPSSGAVGRPLEQRLDLVIAKGNADDSALFDQLEIMRAYDPGLPIVLLADGPLSLFAMEAATTLGLLDYLDEAPTPDQIHRLLRQATNARSADVDEGLVARELDLSMPSVVLDRIVEPHLRQVTGYFARISNGATDRPFIGVHELARRAFEMAPFGTSVFLELSAEDLLAEVVYVDAMVMQRAHDIVLCVRADDEVLRSPDLGHRARRLRAAGFRIAIIDASARQLGELDDLAPDFVTIDHRFTRGVEGSRGRLAIVAAWVAKAHALEALVLARGVSNVEQRNALMDAGCDLVQGPLVKFAGSGTERPRAMAAGER